MTYRGDAWEDVHTGNPEETWSYPKVRHAVQQWHVQRTPDEPECLKGKWRTRDRSLVVDIAQMPDDYLRNIEKFTRDKYHHMVKRGEIQAEMKRRELTPL